jgi:hypothetical protein
MPWSRKLSAPLVLKDGRVISTLGQAREMMLSVPPDVRREPVWRYITEFLDDAAADKASVAHVEELLLRGLKAARMI